MNNKEILHQILNGMCGYLSCGVPDPYWELAITLTNEIYGPSGAQLLEQWHTTHDGAVDATGETTLHTIYGFEDDAEIGPEELIEKLERL